VGQEISCLSSVSSFLGLLYVKCLLLSRDFYNLVCSCLAKKNFCACSIAAV